MKKIIHGIERVNGDGGHNYMFPVAMEKLMRYFGEDGGLDFTLFAAATGDAFCQVAHIYPDFGFNDSFSGETKNTLTPIFNAFKACGYGCECVKKPEIASDREAAKARIKASIDAGVPVLSFGAVGPGNCAIISGYDEDGEVLYGFSQFQDWEDCKSSPEDSPEGYFRKRGAIDCSDMLIFVGEKGGQPSFSEVWTEIAETAPTYFTLPSDGNFSFGAEAFKSWADGLLDDEIFADDGKYDELLDAHQGTLCIAATNLHIADDIIARMKAHCPNAANLPRLERVFAAQKPNCDKIFALQGGFGVEKDKLFDRAFRAELAAAVTAMGEALKW